MRAQRLLTESGTTASPASWARWSRLAGVAVGYASGAAAAGLLLTYVVGFVIVNYYLASFGVRELDPIRARYVAASLPFLLLLALTTLLILEVEHSALGAFIARLRARGRPGRSIAWLARLSVVSFGYSMLLSLLYGSGSANTFTLDQAVEIVFFAGFVLTAFDVGRHLRTIEPPTLRIIQSYFPLGAAILAVGIYATGIYPRLPTWMGGGKPDDVELAVSPAVRSVCPECVPGGFVRLIDEESTRIVVLVVDARGTRAIEISRSDVQAIAHRAKGPIVR